MPIPSKKDSMNTKDIGNIGEAKALAKFVEMGIPVFVSFGDNNPADFIVLVDNHPLKIQVKTSSAYDGSRTVFALTSSTVHRKNGNKHVYSIEEVDYFVCYDTETDSLFLIKNEGRMIHVSIRYSNTKNNQCRGVRFYKDYLLCVETLHGISLRDKDKVQTTM